MFRAVIAGSRPGRGVSGAVVAALAGVLLAGCAQAVSGSPQADKGKADEAMATLFERSIKAFRDHFENLGDEKGKVFNYLRFGSKNRNREFEVVKQGTRTPSLLVKQSDGEPGDSYDEFHPSGANVDYVRLGDKHAHLAPTPWVSVPTIYPKSSPVNPCSTLNAFVGCRMDRALAQTKLDAPDRQPRQTAGTPDGGTEISTGITLKNAIDEDLVVPPAELADKVTAEMKNEILGVRIEFGPDGKFRKFEMRSTVNGETPVKVELGYEVTGESSDDDFPKVPKPNEVTALTDKAAVDKFWDDIANDR